MSSAPETTARKEGTPLSRAMRPLNHLVERFIPSALVFSIVLTFIVALLGLVLTPTSPADLVVHWGDGLAGLLAFMTQMALILLLGHILANTGPVRRLLATSSSSWSRRSPPSSPGASASSSAACSPGRSPTRAGSEG
jgi:short-chain fatty acids transporter